MAHILKEPQKLITVQKKVFCIFILRYNVLLYTYLSINIIANRRVRASKGRAKGIFTLFHSYCTLYLISKGY